ncbi:MAG: tRNA (adenosine(37)-N6)-dimethylallyltransferase MiaA [Phycisphaeraceae bacterium]
MPAPEQPRPIILLGPTAGGKTELAIQLAEALGGEVINADSMQVYQLMDAGTAKPTPDQRARVPHRGVDCAHPSSRFTVSDWRLIAESSMVSAQNRAKRPIIAGGTNLYLKALLHGMFDGPPADEAYRASLAAIDSPQLHAQLREVDPQAAERIAPADRKRILRALEVHHQTGVTITSLQAQWTDDPDQPYRHNPILIGLDWPTDAINARINLRVKAMFYPDKVQPELAQEVLFAGRTLVEETADLESRGLLGVQAREAIGTKQVLEHLKNPTKVSLEEAYEKTKIQSRRLGKQQRTWMKRYHHVHWIPMTPETSPEQAAKAALNAIRAAEK